MQRITDLRVADGIGDRRFCQPGDTDQIASLHLIHRHPLGPFKAQQLGQTANLYLAAIKIDCLDRAVHTRRALHDAAGQAAPQKRITVQKCGQHGEGLVRFHLRRRHMGQHPVKKRMQIVTRPVKLFTGPAITARSIEDREVQLFVISIQRDKEIEHLIHHRIRAAIGTVNLVDHNNRAQPLFQRLAKNEFCLRHRAFSRIGQKNDPVSHTQHTFHLTAKISMARGVDDVDARVLPDHRCRLCQNCNAAFLFQIA